MYCTVCYEVMSDLLPLSEYIDYSLRSWQLSITKLFKHQPSSTPIAKTTNYANLILLNLSTLPYITLYIIQTHHISHLHLNTYPPVPLSSLLTQDIYFSRLFFICVLWIYSLEGRWNIKREELVMGKFGVVFSMGGFQWGGTVEG